MYSGWGGGLQLLEAKTNSTWVWSTISTPVCPPAPSGQYLPFSEPVPQLDNKGYGLDQKFVTSDHKKGVTAPFENLMTAVSRLSLDRYHIPYKLTETVNDPLPKSQEHGGTSLVVQRLRLRAPNAGGPGSNPGQGTRSHMPQLRPGRAKTKNEHIKSAAAFLTLTSHILTI